MDFSDQVTIVTGGTGSLGREIVTGLIERGSRVLFCYRQRDEVAQELVDLLGHDDRLVAIKADVRNQEAMNTLVEEALSRWERLDTLITAHSAVSNAPIVDMTLEQWNEVLDVMLRGVTRVCRAALRPMQKARYGRIVNVVGYQPLAGALMQANYAAALGGVIGFSKALAREVAAWGITINCVAPGLISRPQMAAFDPSYIPWATNIVPLKRLGTPAEIVPAVLMLAKGESGYMTGQTITVDGGWRMV
jgi:3-oxoacyl-[acyl-carrier protein] reductase